MKCRMSSRSAAVLVLVLAFSTLQVSAQPGTAGVDGVPIVAGDDGHRVVLGSVVPVGAGTGRSWVQIDESGHPVRLGLTLTEAALGGLPEDVTPGMIWSNEYILGLPSDVPGLPFDHVGLNWNPRGHPPNEVYGTGHFDVHFYLIGPDERRRISARGADLETIRKVPPPGYMAPDYLFAPESEEPGMGGHWVNPESHEFHGMGFTATFIYGTYDGEIIFYEPMISRDFLALRQDNEYRVSVPEKYGAAGFYPTGYSVRFDDVRNEYVISLEGLTERVAG